MYIDIVEIRFWIANGQISSIFDRVISLQHNSGEVVVSFHIFIYGVFSTLLILSWRKMTIQMKPQVQLSEKNKK